MSAWIPSSPVDIVIEPPATVITPFPFSPVSSTPESELAWIPSSVELILIVAPDIVISLSALIPLVE